jgi:hypothetical protein
LSSIPEMKESLRQASLEAYREDYKKLTDTWHNLEGKAQGNVAIAGIFIAGAFAFIREIEKNAYLHEKIFLATAITCLVISVVLSILTLRIRWVAFPPVGENVDRLVADLLRISDPTEFSNRLPLFFNDQIAEWRIVNDAVDEANKLKAKHLWRAQLFLLSSIIIIALLLFTRIFD